MERGRIKGKQLGEGRPLVCVPVMEERKEGIVREVRHLCERGTDMIEWRVDAFARMREPEAVREVLLELAEVLGESLLLVTFRSRAQGGCAEITQQELAGIWKATAETGAADLVDVEFFETESVREWIRFFQEQGVGVVASHHDFAATPPSDTIRTLLEEMKDGGADIVKLAVMPQQERDVLRLMEETLYFRNVYRDKPIITMAMGELGMISRISGELTGSCVTFAAGARASAPGQLPVEELEMILDTLHRDT